MRDELQHVSRETIERLEVYQRLVLEWTSKINLISKFDRRFIWSRHIVDSLQIIDIAPRKFARWLDIGSGGGFPGIIVAIKVLEYENAGTVTLVESDGRKAAFLRTVLRETGAQGIVLNARIESIDPQNADVISARALADLTTLIGYSLPHLSKDAVSIFAKGAKWPGEIETARRHWLFDCSVHPSRLNSKAAILKIKNIAHV